MKYSDSLKTGLEATGQKWDGLQWYDLFLCGKKVGSIVGYHRAVSQLRGIANTAGVDVRAARRAYLEARDAETYVAQAPENLRLAA